MKRTRPIDPSTDDQGDAYPTEPLPPLTPRPSPPPQPEAQAGTSVEDSLRGTPYRYVRHLSGRRTMGEVVEAEHTGLRRRVVVKLIRESFADSAQYVDRMRLEAQALAAISHPHVVVVLDVGKTLDGRAFLVMEKLVGRTLEDELRARRFLPVAEAVDLTRQLLDGLGAAHALGVVHRDIKPANLFLCDVPRGPRTLKILDFGVAKVLRSVASEASPAPLSQPTAPLSTVGSPYWMAPEQIVADTIGPWTDLYAVGAVLYTLVTGHQPFAHHEDVPSRMLAIAGEHAPLPSIGSPQEIPAAVEEAIMKALERRREDRWASAAEMSDALALALSEATSAREVPTARLSPPARLSREHARTVGGGTAVQPRPRIDRMAPRREHTRSTSAVRRVVQRASYQAALGAAALAAVVGAVLGYALLGHRQPRPVLPHEDATPIATSEVRVPAPVPPSPSASSPRETDPSATVVASAPVPVRHASAAPIAPAKPVARTEAPRRRPRVPDAPAVPTVTSFAPPMEPPPTTTATPARRPFGVED